MIIRSEDVSRTAVQGNNSHKLKRLVEDAGRFKEPTVLTPSMINYQEQRLLYMLAAEYFEDRGGMIDAGVFLGASTNCLVAGLRANREYSSFDKPRITALDLCRCDEYMAKLINDIYKMALRSGDGFDDILERNVKEARGDIDLRLGDIGAYEPEHKIEVLFLDVCKDPAINRHVVSTFFPKLMPGVSVVVHQDFVHESLPWIHVSMGILADYFEFIGVVGDFGPSAVYLCTKAIPPSVCDVYGFASMPVLKAAFATAVSELDDVQSYFVDLAYTRLLAGRGQTESAMKELDRLDGLYEQFRQRCAYLPTTAAHRARLHTSWATVR